MQKTKLNNSQESKTESYSRENLQNSLERALDKVHSKSCDAIYITQMEKSPAEAVMLDINEYEYLQQRLQTYNALLHDSADKTLSKKLDTIEQKIDAIQDDIDVIKYVK